MTVPEAQEKIDSVLFAEYAAFYQLEPFGQEFEQSGQIAAQVGNTVGRKDGKQWKSTDFYPVEPQTTEDEIEGALISVLGAIPHGSEV